MQGHSRSYSYDDQAGYSPTDTSHGGNSSDYYSPHMYQQQSNEQYYTSAGQTPSSAHGSSDLRYARSSTPGPGMGRNTRNVADPRYYSSSAMMSSSSNSGNATHSAPYYSSQAYHSSQSTSSSGPSGDRFIPTPSEIAHSYSYSSSTPDQHPSHSPSMYTTPGHHSRPHRHLSTSPVLSSNRPSSMRSHAPTSPSTERFPCEVCGKTFSRSHDRKRHHETQHITSPVLHRCRFCRKEFSRADSLKRHLDNGCDEMPSAGSSSK